MRHAALPILSLIALTGGCVPPRSLSPTLAAHTEAITAIQAGYEADLSLLAAQLAAAIAARRTLLLGRIERDLVDRGYLDESGPEMLRADLANVGVENALLNDIRHALLSITDAESLVADLRTADSLTEPLASEVRTQLLERLHTVRAFDASANELRAAMAEHGADIAWLFEESGRSASALRAYAEQRPRLPDTVASNAPDLWSRLVLTRITDPAKRAAAEQLLAELLSLSTLASN